MRLDRAGTLAEACAVIAGLFEAADETASMYLAGVRAQADTLQEADREEKAS